MNWTRGNQQQQIQLVPCAPVTQNIDQHQPLQHPPTRSLQTHLKLNIEKLKIYFLNIIEQT